MFFALAAYLCSPSAGGFRTPLVLQRMSRCHPSHHRTHTHTVESKFQAFLTYLSRCDLQPPFCSSLAHVPRHENRELKVFGREYPEAPPKVRGRCLAFMSRKLRGRAARIRNWCFRARAEAKTSFNPISQSAEATGKRFPLQNLSRKEPFMPRKLLRGRDLIFLFGRNWV